MKLCSCGNKLPNQKKQTKYCSVCRTIEDKRYAHARYLAADKTTLALQSKNWYAKIVAVKVAALGTPERCEICGIKFSETVKPHWDHNHKYSATKRKPTAESSRGWLCTRCNTGLGALGDSPAILRRAVEYLEAKGYHQTRPVLR